MSGFVFPRWLAIITHGAGLPAAHAMVPWLLAGLSTRHGWRGGTPSLWNAMGLLPVAGGVAILIWSVREHFRSAPDGWRLERTSHYPTPAYLLTGGPYRYSRNPIYLAYTLIWPGWIIFYGSVPILGVFAAMSLFVTTVVMRMEERGLQARFGDAYQDYARRTPRWL